MRIRVRGRFGAIRDGSGDSVRFGAIRIDSGRFKTIRDDSGRFGTVRGDSGRFGTIRNDTVFIDVFVIRL